MSRHTAVLVLALALAGCGGDTTSPPDGVARLEPARNATDAGVGQVITVQYRSDVTVPSAAVASAIVVLHGPDTVAGAVRVKSERVLEFTPTDILEFGESYSVHVSAAVRSASGQSLEPLSWTFTTNGSAPVDPDGARMLSTVQALAHDSMAGRRAGTSNEARAALLVRTRLAGAGLAYLTGTASQQTFTVGTLTSQNVYMALPGEGELADEWVVVGAHYDHIGENSAGVFNGADDNASGTAGMLELARVLTAHVNAGGFAEQPRRSVLFIAFGAEELGLYGSNWYCAHPLVPLDRTAGMINLDMIGRLRNQAITAHGVDSAPQWAALLNRYRGSVTWSAGGLVGTDYRCFLDRGRPALALFTGLHEDYHRVTDDADRINVPGMVSVARIALHLATNLMLRPTMPGSVQ